MNDNNSSSETNINNNSSVETNIKNNELGLPIVTLKKCLEADCFYGQKTYKWNPKMKDFIYCKKNGNHIINLNKTLEYIVAAYNEVKKIIKNNGKILFVNTKEQAQESVIENALRSGSFYVVNRWLGGILTNFKIIQSRIQHLKKIERVIENNFEEISKKEKSKLKKEKEKLLRNLEGIKEMRDLPQALFIVDPDKDKKVINEAKKLKITIFAITNTNNDPSDITFPIPANNTSVKSIKFILEIFADAIVEAKGGTTIIAYNNNGNDPDSTMDDVIALIEKRFNEKIALIKKNKIKKEENYKKINQQNIVAQVQENKKENN